MHGKFTAHDLQMANYSLVAYSFGLLGFMLVKVLAPGYFARQDTKTPMKVAMIAMVANMVFNVILVVILVRLEFVAPHAGLALATTFSSFINAMLLLRGLLRDKVFLPEAGWLGFILRVILAAGAMGFALWWLAGNNADWVVWSVWQRIAQLVWLIVVGAAIYFAVLWLSGVRLALFRRPVSG